MPRPRPCSDSRPASRPSARTTPSRRPRCASSRRASRRCRRATQRRGRTARSCRGRSRAACGTRGARRCRRRWPRHPSPSATARSPTPAVRDAAVFTPTLMTAGGPDNGWFPTPDRPRADRVRRGLAGAVAARRGRRDGVAGLRRPRRDAGGVVLRREPVGGVDVRPGDRRRPTTDSQPDGSVNRNSGAESTIHGLLTMIALDARPELGRARAHRGDHRRERAAAGGARPRRPISTTAPSSRRAAWTGESLWSGDALPLAAGAARDVRHRHGRRLRAGSSRSSGRRRASRAPRRWASKKRPIGALSETGPDAGDLADSRRAASAPAVAPVARRSHRGARRRCAAGDLTLDTLLVRPFVSRLVLSGDRAECAQLVHSSAKSPQPTRRSAPTGMRDHVIRVRRRPATLVARAVRHRARAPSSFRWEGSRSCRAEPRPPCGEGANGTFPNHRDRARSRSLACGRSRCAPPCPISARGCRRARVRLGVMSQPLPSRRSTSGTA